MFEKKLTAKILVEGMHCNHCKAKVEAALRSAKGVKAFEVSLEASSADVTYSEGKTTPAEIADAVTNAGFNASVK